MSSNFSDENFGKFSCKVSLPITRATTKQKKKNIPQKNAHLSKTKLNQLDLNKIENEKLPKQSLVQLAER